MLSPEGAFCLPGFASREKLWGLGDATEARLGAAIRTLFLLVLAAPRLSSPFATGRAPTRVVSRADFLDPWVPTAGGGRRSTGRASPFAGAPARLSGRTASPSLPSAGLGAGYRHGVRSGRVGA